MIKCLKVEEYCLFVLLCQRLCVCIQGWWPNRKSQGFDILHKYRLCKIDFCGHWRLVRNSIFCQLINRVRLRLSSKTQKWCLTSLMIGGWEQIHVFHVTSYRLDVHDQVVKKNSAYLQKFEEQKILSTKKLGKW